MRRILRQSTSISTPAVAPPITWPKGIMGAVPSALEIQFEKPMTDAAAIATLGGVTSTASKLAAIARETAAKPNRINLARCRSALRRILEQRPVVYAALATAAREHSAIGALGVALMRANDALGEIDGDLPDDTLTELFQLERSVGDAPGAGVAMHKEFVAIARAASVSVNTFAASLLDRGCLGAAGLLQLDHGITAEEPLRQAHAAVLRLRAALTGGQHQVAEIVRASAEEVLAAGIPSAEGVPSREAITVELERLSGLIGSKDSAARIAPETGAEMPSRGHDDFARAGADVLPDALRDALGAYQMAKSSGAPAEVATLREAACHAMESFRSALLEGSKLTQAEAKRLAGCVFLEGSLSENDRTLIRPALAEFIRLTEGRTLLTSQCICRESKVEITIPFEDPSQDVLDDLDARLRSTDCVVFEPASAGDGAILISAFLWGEREPAVESLRKALARESPRGSGPLRLEFSPPETPTASWTNVNLGDAYEKDDLVDVLWHELAHHLETVSMEVERASMGCLRAISTRTEPGSADEVFGPDSGWPPNMLFFDADFPERYLGRVYPDGGTEVLSVSAPYFRTAERMVDLFDANPLVFAYALGVMRKS